MELFKVMDEIEIGNEYVQDGLDYYMDCVVEVNKVKTRCEQISIVQCDMSKYGKGIEILLELRRGEWLTWLYLDDVDSLSVDEIDKWVIK
ncbi:MAG: hypothetical protein J6Y78_11385 [Paludibacteraceae bacterium]|nr:hypothetical protein [Paludibacteraceae bacterium]